VQLALRLLLGSGCLALLLAAAIFSLLNWRARTAARIVRANAELVLAARRSRRQDGLFEAVMDSVREGVIVVDQRGRLVHGNPTALALVGPDATARDLPPDHWQEEFGFHHVDGTPLPIDEEPISRALAGETVESAEILLRNEEHPSGVRLEVSAAPLDPSTGQAGVVSVLRDVTALRAHEAELLAYAGIVAHDLKSPLTSVNGYVELLEDELGEAEPDQTAVTDAVYRIKSGTARMRSLIDDLLAYATARDAPLDLTDFGLRSLVDEVVANRVGHLRSARGLLTPEVYVGALPVVRADRALLRQLLDNLVGNALKYTPRGQPARLDITARYDKPDWVLVEVADRGIGIPAGQHEVVFTGFHRAHPTSGYAGTGLGLAICQRVAERHGGSIAASDNPGGGARFCFAVPAGSAKRVQPSPASNPPRPRAAART
jgi:signal transduction histidine kinase